MSVKEIGRRQLFGGNGSKTGGIDIPGNDDIFWCYLLKIAVFY